MATAKKGLLDQAIDAVTDVFESEPARKSAPRKAPAKKTAPKSRAVSSDRKLVSTMEDYEVKYLAQKHSVTQKAVKAAVTKVGHSRSKVEAELKKGKTA